MGKYEKKKEKKSKKGIIIAAVLVIVLVALALFVMPQVLYRINGGDSSVDAEITAQESQAEGTETAGTTEPAENTEAVEEYSPDDELAFPCLLENGMLEVETLFPYSGINPDAGNQDAKNVAALTLKNMSNQYLKSATITVTLQDGTLCSFTVTDLPAGTSATVFATGNESLAQDGFCVDLSTEAVFEDIPIWDQIAVSVEGMTVTLQNISDEALSEIDVYCRDVFGESYFGGITYKHTINELPAGQSTTFDVSDSILGMIDVVRIAIND